MPRRLLILKRWAWHGIFIAFFCAASYVAVHTVDYSILRAVTRSIQLLVGIAALIVFFDVAYSAFVTTPMTAEDRLSTGIWVSQLGVVGIAALIVYASSAHPEGMTQSYWFPFFVGVQTIGGIMQILVHKSRRNVVLLALALGTGGALAVSVLGVS